MQGILLYPKRTCVGTNGMSAPDLTALGVRTESSLKFEIEIKNIILVPLRFFEFSHRLGQTRTLLLGAARPLPPTADVPPQTSGAAMGQELTCRWSLFHQRGARWTKVCKPATQRRAEKGLRVSDGKILVCGYSSCLFGVPSLRNVYRSRSRRKW